MSCSGHRFTRARSLPAWATVAAAVVLAGGCGSAASGGSEAETTAVATTTHVADLVRNVGGGRVDVHQVLPPGADPHAYEPRPSDAQAVAESAVLFESGGDLDDWLGGLTSAAGSDAPVVTLLEEVETAADDPHWWQDPHNAVAAVDVIAEGLSEADPAGADSYRRNAARYERRIRAVDTQVARCMRGIPEAQRKLVTTHDSYGRFAERYDIDVVGAVVPSRSTHAQPSAGETAALVDQIEAEGVGAIFPESALNPELEQAVAGEAGAMVGDRLWADSLGPEDSGGATYLEALASDAEAMSEGFAGEGNGCDIAVPGA